MGKYLDTRDLEERLVELEDERQALEDAVTDAQDALDSEKVESAKKALEEWDESEDAEELKELQSMRDEIGEWNYGETLIPEEDFVDYVEEMIKDIGDLPKEVPWYIAIDWDQTAENVKADYSTVEYQGTTYLYRMS